jgi:AhpD family alkylhydroperoxidase
MTCTTPERLSREYSFSLFPALPQALTTLAEQIKAVDINPGLIHLLEIRASQINGCAFCMDMHMTEARQHGEEQQRLDVISAWREVPWFCPAERAALDWCETLTRLPNGHATDEQFAALQEHFSEQQIVAITAAITVINSWNRVVSALGFVPDCVND